MSKSLSTLLSSYSGLTTVLQVLKSNVSSYTLQIEDAGKHICFANGTTSTVTVPSNANVEFKLGTTILLINDNSGRMTINTQSNVVVQLVTSTTGNRSISSKGVASLLKIDTNKWYLSGAGIK